jgi:4-hydroxybenzoate polyprenyltransferase
VSLGRGLAAIGAVAHARNLLEAVKFEHTIFALPFAYLGMILASRGTPTWQQLLWITIAMVAARTLAMSANRVIDRRLDAANPRTAQRALPRGILSPEQMIALCAVSLIVFLFAAWQLNDLCLKLAPLAAIIVVGYSYTKRFTWMSHFILGVSDGIAPIGGWLAVSGEFSLAPVLLGLAVALWIGGFDVIYACQDVDFDRRHGLKSIPASFGIAAALASSAAAHALTVALLVVVGLLLGLSPVYYVGVAIAVALLVWEHRLVSPSDLSRLNVAFFNVNGYIAVIVFVFTLAAVLVGAKG